MYLFGKFIDSLQCDESILGNAFATGRRLVPKFAEIPISDLVETLDNLSKVWVHGGDYWTKAFELTRAELPFSDDMISYSLDVIAELLSAQNISTRIKSDFGSLEKLDKFVRSHSFNGRERAFPLGLLFHVSAGNVFLGAIDSLLMGFLTKNVSLVKLSSRNLAFPLLFAQSIVQVDRNNVIADKFCLLHFSSGQSQLEDLIKRESNAIIAWGGEEMILAYKSGLGIGVKFIEYGPKISFQVITLQAVEKHGLKQTAEWIARDVAMWDQAACASPQNLFIEHGIDVSKLMDEISIALGRFPYARGRLSDDEQVEILKELSRARFSKIMRDGDYRSGSDHLLHFDTSPGLRTSPLNRSLIIKRYHAVPDLIGQLSSYSRFLQSCSILALDDEMGRLTSMLGNVGVMRFTHLGQVMEAPIGAPHDGRMTLTELTRIVPEEIDSTLQGLANDAIAHVPFYNELRTGSFIRDIGEMPLLKGSDFDTGNAEKISRFTHGNIAGGYVFSSGGTSGAPKYMIYTHDEFDQVAGLLETAFRAQGVQQGSVVANLFVAGNLWSSFIAVDQAMARIGARVLPIGGLADRDLTITYIDSFKPEFIVGLPTQIVELARRAVDTGRILSLPVVLYAGEHMNLSARAFLQTSTGTNYFGSAGYASVDAGPIGYQCRYCEGGVHHVFSNHVHLEIIDGEGVVTSRIKRAMPVIRLRTGDLIEWISREICSECDCGSRDRKFRLLGRADSQINMWGCRLFINDFEKSIGDCDLTGALFQIEVAQDATAAEIAILRIETAQVLGIDEHKVKDCIYRNSHDLMGTHPRSWLDSRLKIEMVANGGIERVKRTGKIKPLIERR